MPICEADPQRAGLQQGNEMRFFPIITAIAAIVVLFFVVFQRDRVREIAGYGPGDTRAEAETAAQ